MNPTQAANKYHCLLARTILNEFNSSETKIMPRDWMHWFTYTEIHN